MESRCRSVHLLGGLAVLLFGSHLVVQDAMANEGLIVRDGRLGDGPLVVPFGDDDGGVHADYLITAEMGEERNGNLFHTFETFGIGVDEIATFLDGSLPVDTIVAAVTGGGGSTIRGTLRTTAAHADFYLLNPNGVIFGEGAAFDLPAAFFVSTANRLVFSGGVFDPGSSGSPFLPSLTGIPCCSGQPVDFIFDGGSAGDIVFNESATWHDDVHISASHVRVTEGVTLRTTHGVLEIAAIGDQAATIPAGVGGEAFAPAAGWGEIEVGRLKSDRVEGALTELSQIRSDVGRVVLRGGNLVFRHARVRVLEAPGNAPTIDLGASESVQLLEGSALQGLGAPGVLAPDFLGIRVASPNVFLSGESRFLLSANPGRSAGSIQIVADMLELTGSGTALASSSNGEAPGGGIDIDTSALVLAEGAEIRSQAAGGSGRAGGIEIETGSLRLGGGSSILVLAENSATEASGAIAIHAESVLLEGESSIRSETHTASPGGSIHLNVDGNLRLGGASAVRTRPFGTGDAGEIVVSAGSVDLERGGQILSEAGTACDIASGACSIYEVGSTGNITLSVDGALRVSGLDVIINGVDSLGEPVLEVAPSLISTRVLHEASASSQAGNITLVAGSVEVSEAGLISSRTFSLAENASRAGTIEITADTSVRVTGTVVDPLEPLASRVSEISARGLKGQGGSIAIAAQSVEVSAGGAIKADGFGTEDAGSIAVNAAQTILMVDGEITTEAGKAEGGNITLDAGHLIHLVRSRVETKVRSDAGSGGDIRMGQGTEPTFAVFESSSIKTDAVAGAGGDITISAGSLLKSPDKSPSPDISARSDKNVDGEIRINALEEELSGRLVPLDLAYMDASSLVLPPCAARVREDRSSLTVRGRPGLGPDPAGLLPSPIVDITDSGGPEVLARPGVRPPDPSWPPGVLVSGLRGSEVGVLPGQVGVTACLWDSSLSAR